MPIIALLRSNEEQKTIVSSQQCVVIDSGVQAVYLTFTFPELRKVEGVLQVEIETNPETLAHAELPQDKRYVGNTVGMTLTCEPTAGTTLCAECVAIGW